MSDTGKTTTAEPGCEFNLRHLSTIATNGAMIGNHLAAIALKLCGGKQHGIASAEELKGIVLGFSCMFSAHALMSLSSSAEEVDARLSAFWPDLVEAMQKSTPVPATVRIDEQGELVSSELRGVQ